MQLLCAAVIDELEPLLKSTAFRQEGPELFRHPRKNLLVAALGVGLVDFASGFQALLERYQVAEALLTGTCGVYPAAAQKWPPVSLVAPLEISLGDLAEVNRSGYFPAPITATCMLDEKFSRGFLADADTHCLTLTAITSDDQAASLIEKFYHCHFEQMEAYAFARLCQRRKITAAALFAVVNQVGRDGHRQWRLHAQQGACLSAELLRQKLNLL